MYYEEQEYSVLISKAEDGDPLAMYKLAMLCGAGLVGTFSEESYVHWLKAFLNSDVVKNILTDIDDEDFVYDGDPLDYYKYAPSIVEAGIALGLYYINSGQVAEVELAQKALYSAFIASRFDYSEVEDEGEATDLVSLLGKASKRLSMLKGEKRNDG